MSKRMDLNYDDVNDVFVVSNCAQICQNIKVCKFQSEKL